MPLIQAVYGDPNVQTSISPKQPGGMGTWWSKCLNKHIPMPVYKTIFAKIETACIQIDMAYKLLLRLKYHQTRNV